ncbi:hydrogenase expression/formation protein HypE [Clostridium sp. MB40-C1]|uniref:hydrogenase expression/formation protein HypE n=1 Tax=Clostridium sp. MB40-C1 TaxID=3070996 RepID=UPI0027E16D49|nr:hydrogenase expression/formation protein HypE [Clostridium sp. MB40-C1]WMJ82480.1 hydrogenase expression/formation protein HypE [Clostridium sp. MB40-C1]
MESVKLIHGEGGKYTEGLIKDVFYEKFKNDILLKNMDSALLEIPSNKIAFTTDSFVVNPIFFRGGDIGKLAVCGTINDLTVCGAEPLYLSSSFIIEEGFSMQELKKIVNSMKETCIQAKLNIVTGDTKVVPKGKVDKVFINTAGIGVVKDYFPKKIKKGDKVIVTGTIAEHGTAIAVDRYNLNVKGKIQSDCAPLNFLLECLKRHYESIKFMRDPTRGGLGQVLNEIANQSELGLHIFENKIPIRDEVKSINEMLGINPLYLACEGRMIVVVDKYASEDIMKVLVKECNCDNASVIGEFTDEYEFVYIENDFGGKRILGSLDTQILPRIC